MSSLVKKSFLKDKRIEVIKNGVDLSVFKQTTSNTQSSPPQPSFSHFAVSNVWMAYKGELDIYKLREMLPKEEYKITMVGLSADQVKESSSRHSWHPADTDRARIGTTLL